MTAFMSTGAGCRTCLRPYASRSRHSAAARSAESLMLFIDAIWRDGNGSIISKSARPITTIMVLFR